VQEDTLGEIRSTRRNNVYFVSRGEQCPAQGLRVAFHATSGRIIYVDDEGYSHDTSSGQDSDAVATIAGRQM
jgi:hypothetical protein